MNFNRKVKRLMTERGCSLAEAQILATEQASEAPFVKQRATRSPNAHPAPVLLARDDQGNLYRGTAWQLLRGNGGELVERAEGRQ
jgi:hypothetical protein